MSIKFSCDICGQDMPDRKQIRQWDRKFPFREALYVKPPYGYPIEVCESCDMDIQVFIKNCKAEYIKEENS